MKHIVEGNYTDIVDYKEIESVEGKYIVQYYKETKWVFLAIRLVNEFSWLDIDSNTTYGAYPSLEDCLEHLFPVEGDLSVLMFESRVEFAEWLASIGEARY